MKYSKLIKIYEYSYRKFVKIKGLRIKLKIKYQKTNNINKFSVQKHMGNLLSWATSQTEQAVLLSLTRPSVIRLPQSYR